MVPIALGAVLLLAAVALTLALSGGGTRHKAAAPPAPQPSRPAGALARYRAAAVRASNRFKNSAQVASARVKAARTASAKIAALEQLKATLLRAAGDFGRLNPPARLKHDNAELVAELKTLAGIVGQAQRATRHKDTAAGYDVAARATAAQARIQATIARLQSKIGP